MVSSTYRNAYKEVYEILSYLEDEDYKKIPPEVIKAIENNMNEEYKYYMNDEVDLFNQPMLPETKAILFNLFRDYLSSSEQKEKIIEMQKEERIKIEKKKQQEYSINVFENKKTKEKAGDEIEKNNLPLRIENKSVLRKIFDFIKKLLRK